MSGQADTRNASLDWLRVVSIVYIVGFWHLLNYTEIWPGHYHPLFWRLTVLALGLFVLISGYLMGRGTAPTDRRSLLDFYVRRLIRIYPPYLFALVLYLVMRLTGVMTVVKGALLLGMVVPPPPPTLWFVGMIVLFYVITPALLWLATRPARMIVAVVVASALLWLLEATTPIVDPRLPLYLPVYAAGVLLARFEPLRVTRTAWLALLAAVAAATLLTLLPSDPSRPVDQSFWMAPFALVASVTVFLACNHRLPRNGVVAWLSYGSFFLYLLHRPIYHALVVWPQIPDGPLRFGILLLIGLPLSLVAGWAGQRAYDRAIVPLIRRPGGTRS